MVSSQHELVLLTGRHQCDNLCHAWRFSDAEPDAGEQELERQTPQAPREP
jgi:hypothetical protein